MTILAAIIALLSYAVWYFPVYLPFLLSFLFRAPHWRSLRFVLRTAPIFGFIVLAARTRPQRPDFGDDVAGNIEGSNFYFAHEFWPDIAWIWGTGLSCMVLALLVGFIVCRMQMRRESSSVPSADARTPL